MRKWAFLVGALVLGVPVQAQSVAVLSGIEVRGATDLISGLVKLNLPVQAGDVLSSVNLTAIQSAVFGQGFFQSVAAELQDVEGKTVLVITVVPNPAIKAVAVKSNFIPSDTLKTILEDQFNIASGATVNTVRIERSKDLIAKGYREAGFPFVPSVRVDIQQEKEGATLTYTVEEEVPLSHLDISGNTVLSTSEVEQVFAPLMASGHLDAKLYAQAVQSLSSAYGSRGYVGSGLDLQKSEWSSGTLKLKVREVVVGRLDTTLLGQDVPLSIKSGDLFNVQTLADQVKQLGNRLGQAVEVTYRPQAESSDVLDVGFAFSALPTGKIEDIRLEDGSGVLSDTELKSLLRLKVGDIYNLQLAQDDYLALQKAYRDRGYELSTQPDPIEFSGGMLKLHLREVRIGGYELTFKGGQRTQDRVLLRELPAVGTLFNVDGLRKGIENMIRTGLVRPPQVNIRPSEKDPNQLIVGLETAELSGVTFAPAITYSTLEGWSGQLALQHKNVFGLAHQASVQVQALQNDAGQNWTGSLSYAVPWLDLPIWGLDKVRTGVSVSLYNSVNGNNKLLDSGGIQVENREYTQRSTGIEFSASRPLGTYLSVGSTLSYALENNHLENLTPADSQNRTKEGTTLPPVQTFVPSDGQTWLWTNGLSWDNVNNPEFPTRGVRADVNVGFGLGNSGDEKYQWTRLTGGASTYLGFGGYVDGDVNQQVLAFRVNAGALLGKTSPSRLFTIGGADLSVGHPFTLHGYDPRELTGYQFFTSSMEYRYNFNLSAGVAQGLYGVAFGDVGDAWKEGLPAPKLGWGFGLQLNLGVGAALLPALRFDYAFSQKYPDGKFYFRLGNFF